MRESQASTPAAFHRDTYSPAVLLLIVLSHCHFLFRRAFRRGTCSVSCPQHGGGLSARASLAAHSAEGRPFPVTSGLSRPRHDNLRTRGAKNAHDALTDFCAVKKTCPGNGNEPLFMPSGASAFSSPSGTRCRPCLRPPPCPAAGAGRALQEER